MNESKITVNEEEKAALEVLRSLPMGPLAAAILAREVARVGRGSERRAHRCVQLGEEALRMSEKTVSFRHAVEEALRVRRDRRPRTLSDFRYISCRLMRRCPGLAERRVRSISSAECAAYLNQAFDTPRQRIKAHAILSGIFHTAEQKGWCAINPIYNVEKPRVREQEVPILTQEEIARLMQGARQYRGGICLAAVSLMLYAGLRPYEVTRLEWSDICLAHSCICIRPRHSKTGGARRVTICPQLGQILQSCRRHSGRICPAGWLRHWRQLRQAADFRCWHPDALRHTYASHHLAHFRSYAALQYEMGHRSAELLRTRYVSAPREKHGLFDVPSF